MTETDRERRRDVRVTFRATARLEFADKRVFDNCQTSNISVSGVLVEGVDGVEAGEKCVVDFHLIGRSSSLVLTMTGEVVRVQDQTVALQFAEVDEDSFCHLQNIVYFNYRKEEELDEVIAEPAASVEDKSLYLGLAAGKTRKPLPANFLEGEEEDEEYAEFGADLDRDILDHLSLKEDDEEL